MAQGFLCIETRLTKDVKTTKGRPPHPPLRGPPSPLGKAYKPQFLILSHSSPSGTRGGDNRCAVVGGGVGVAGRLHRAKSQTVNTAFLRASQRRPRRHITRAPHEYHCTKGAISLRPRRNTTATHRVARSTTQKGQPQMWLPSLLNSINFSCVSSSTNSMYP